MSKLENKIDPLLRPTDIWSGAMAKAFEDISEAVIGFIPYGLSVLYDTLLKPIPLLGALFRVPTIELLLKLITGISIGKGIARDAAYYLFRPLGFALGYLIGSTYLFPMKNTVSYRGTFGKIMRQISSVMVGGTLFGLALAALVEQQWGLAWLPASKMVVYQVSAGIGAGLGCLIKLIILYAVHVVGKNQHRSQQTIYHQAKVLGKAVTLLARRQSKGRILTQAQDVLQQVNGPQSQQYLEQFFDEQYDTIANHIHDKIDRHIQFLADRACHGDRKAFQKLKELNITGKSLQGKITALSSMLDKVFNRRAILKLKDAVDTAFDYWYYQQPKIKA